VNTRIGSVQRAAAAASANGWPSHIGPDGSLTEHELPPFAVVQPDRTVRYPALPGV
jgi:hypothetical protein